MQPQFNDLVIATHGRSIYIMDDMTPVQQLQTAVAAGTYLFPVRTSYQYNYREDDEGTLTAYTGNNPPLGAVFSFYESTEPKTPPKIEILDASGHVIRTYEGTHKVNDKDKPWVANKVGLNHFTWDWAIQGPVKWTGAARDYFQGSNDGPGVPPGRYSVRLTLNGKVMTQSFDVKADPLTKYTQTELVDAFNFAKRGEHMFSQVNTMLNNLDTFKKAIADANDAAKKANDADATAKLAALTKAHDDLFSDLTANYQNGEDSIQMPGKLREDVQNAGGFGIVTPVYIEYANKVQKELDAGIGRYNTFVQSQVPQLNSTLTALKLKTIKLDEVH
jgi:hypothetical protein